MKLFEGRSDNDVGMGMLGLCMAVMAALFLILKALC